MLVGQSTTAALYVSTIGSWSTNNGSCLLLDEIFCHSQGVVPKLQQTIVARLPETPGNLEAFRTGEAALKKELTGLIKGSQFSL